MFLSLVFASVLVATAFAGCPDGYTYYKGDNTCLKSVNENKGYFDARRACNSESGDLVQVRDALKATFIRGFHAHAYWTGVWDMKRTQNFAYIDGSPLGVFQPWMSGQPDNKSGRQYCVYVSGTDGEDSGQWNDASCGDEMPYVCEKNFCDKDYIHYGADNTCLRAFDEKKSFGDAREICQSDGGDLVFIHDAVKSLFVDGLQSRPFWMGAWDKTGKRSFHYLDGTPMGRFQPWRKGEPNNAHGREYCVSSSGGEWNDYDCMSALSFVCQH